jgi:hypothetical protein
MAGLNRFIGLWRGAEGLGLRPELVHLEATAKSPCPKKTPALSETPTSNRQRVLRAVDSGSRPRPFWPPIGEAIETR